MLPAGGVTCRRFAHPHLSTRCAGGLGGAGGQGESELQLQRRRIAERRKQLLRQLEQVCMLCCALLALTWRALC